MKYCRGLTLIELLCAIAISSIVITALLELFFSYQYSYKLEQALSSVQENGRFASAVLKKSASQTGYAGCAVLPNSLVIVSTKDYGWKNKIPKNFKLKPKKESDVILVRYVDLKEGHFLKPAVSKDKSITVSLEPKFSKKDVLAISNCNKVVLSKVKRVSSSKKLSEQRIYLSKTLGADFDKHASIGLLKTRLFFVQATSHKTAGGKKIYALYQMKGSGYKKALVQNVVDFKVDGVLIDSGGSFIQKSAEDILGLNNVKFLKFYLLLKSDRPVLKHPKKYWFFHGWHESSDRFLYKEYLLTVAVSN